MSTPENIIGAFQGASEVGVMPEPPEDETRAFTAVELAEATTEPEPEPARHDDPCRCDEHKYGQRPGNGLILHTGPDVVNLMIDRALRDGRYEDIEAYAHDAAPLKVHLPAVEAARRIHRDVASGYQRICAAFDADPRARRDPGLAEAFRRGEEGLGRQLEEMRQWEREYEAWLLTDGRAAA